MYIYLDESLENLDLTNNEILKSIGYLLDGFSEGNFILSAKRNLLKKFSECQNLSKPARNAALVAYSNYASNQSFYNEIPFKIIVTENLTDIINIKNQWIIDISKVQSGFLSQGILILAENLNDSKFLNYTAEHFLIKNKKKLPLLKIKNHFQGGGGETITGELENRLKEMKEFIFCFKDSDKFSPSCEISKNSKKCLNLIDENKWLSFFSNTFCREAENLIPNKLLENTPHIPYTQLDSLRSLEKKINSDFYSYIDIKQGLTKKFYNNLGKKTTKRKYWDNILFSLKELDIIKDCELDLKQNCKNHLQLKEKNCVLLKSGTEQTLEHTINFLESQSFHKSFEIIKNDPTNNEWLKIGETIFWLSCSLPKVRLS